MAITSSRVRLFLAVTFILGLLVAPQAWQAASSPAASPPPSQPPVSGAIPGVRNFTRVDSTIACGGALSPDAFAALKAAGYRSVVNLRPAFEPGNNVEEARKAAQSLGLVYIHLPFDYGAMDAAMLDEFLKAVVKPANVPMMLHCASGNRVSMFWAVKRVMVDGWPVEKAMGELPDLSRNVSPTLRAFVLDYLKARGKTKP